VEKLHKIKDQHERWARKKFGEPEIAADSPVERQVRLLVHRAIFLPSSPEYFFLKATNLSPTREVEIEHVWFATQPPVYIVNPARPLPARLRVDETFETWVPVASVPDVPEVERLGRARLSNGKVVKSRLNKDIPPVGNVAGPGRR
jgi:hypothetical protein